MTQVKGVRCDRDGCDTIDSEHDGAGWFNIIRQHSVQDDEVPEDVRWREQDEGWDFCSYTCIKLWAEGRTMELNRVNPPRYETDEHGHRAGG